MRGTHWVIAFTSLFLLSLDFWAWGSGPGSGPLGIPAWVYYFMSLQLLLAGVIFAFGRTYWTKRERMDDRQSDQDE